MLLNEINPYVRQVLIGGIGGVYTSRDTFTSLYTRDCRLFYILEGTGYLTTDSETFKLEPDCAVLFQSGTSYRWNSEHADIVSINFDYTMNFSHKKSPYHPIRAQKSIKNKVFENIHFEDAPLLNSPLYIQNASFIKSHVETMSSLYYLDEKYVPELLSSYMKMIICSILYEEILSSKSQTGKDLTTVEKAIQYIQNHYSDDITNESIAAYVHFNPSYVNRIFKEYTQTSLHAFVINYRINLAKEILRTQDTPINQIATSVGFSDIPHFVKLFKRRTGLTPSQYRTSWNKADKETQTTF